MRRVLLRPASISATGLLFKETYTSMKFLGVIRDGNGTSGTQTNLMLAYKPRMYNEI